MGNLCSCTQGCCTNDQQLLAQAACPKSSYAETAKCVAPATSFLLAHFDLGDGSSWSQRSESTSATHPGSPEMIRPSIRPETRGELHAAGQALHVTRPSAVARAQAHGTAATSPTTCQLKQGPWELLPPEPVTDSWADPHSRSASPHLQMTCLTTSATAQAQVGGGSPHQASRLSGNGGGLSLPQRPSRLSSPPANYQLPKATSSTSQLLRLYSLQKPSRQSLGQPSSRLQQLEAWSNTLEKNSIEPASAPDDVTAVHQANSPHESPCRSSSLQRFHSLPAGPCEKSPSQQGGSATALATRTPARRAISAKATVLEPVQELVSLSSHTPIIIHTSAPSDVAAAPAVMAGATTVETSFISCCTHLDSSQFIALPPLNAATSSCSSPVMVQQYSSTQAAHGTEAGLRECVPQAHTSAHATCMQGTMPVHTVRDGDPAVLHQLPQVSHSPGSALVDMHMLAGGGCADDAPGSSQSFSLAASGAWSPVAALRGPSCTSACSISSVQHLGLPPRPRPPASRQPPPSQHLQQHQIPPSSFTVTQHQLPQPMLHVPPARTPCHSDSSGPQTATPALRPQRSWRSESGQQVRRTRVQAMLDFMYSQRAAAAGHAEARQGPVRTSPHSSRSRHSSRHSAGSASSDVGAPSFRCT